MLYIQPGTMNFFTIGVFNSSEEEFFNKLIENKIDTFCDIRQRRVVRGRKYAFVNSTRLQRRLAGFNIRYIYLKELALTTKIRELQKMADDEKRESNVGRQQLEPLFISEYQKPA